MKKCLLAFLVLIWAASFAFAESQAKTCPWRDLKYTARSLRDPFGSPFELRAGPFAGEEIEKESTVKYGLSHLKIEGMVWGTTMPQVIINGMVLRVGEVIQGAEILSIRKEGVYVLHEGNQYILRSVIGAK